MPSLTLDQQSRLAQLFNRFLKERGFSCGAADVFDERSKEGTRQLQSWLIEQDPANRRKRIQIDGKPGNQTFGYACAISADDGFTPSAIAEATDFDYPRRLGSLPQPSPAHQTDLFGAIVFERAPTDSNKERIVITNGFAQRNIVAVRLPQLVGMEGAPASGKVSVHRAIAAQLQALWAAWEAQGISGLITGFGGMWVPRLIRGSQKTLSNHAWGTAFDVNVSANYLWHLPAFPGESGSIFRHVPIAQDYGFGWGGHYRQRLDGMHFEALKVLTGDELRDVNMKYQLNQA